MSQCSANDVTAPRPNPSAKWVCGYQRAGLACGEGPDADGVCCQMKGERKKAVDHESCEANCSGRHSCELTGFRRQPQLPSHSELGPCIPQRAAWFSRHVIMVNLALLTAGGLLLCMSLPHREAIFVPGGLSSKHAQILGNLLVSERCSLCHPNSHADVSSMVLQDDLCMKCHTSHMPDAAIRSPHDLTTTQLVSLANPAQAASGEAELSRMKSTQCAMCHIEHHGNGFDLTAMTDASCQACHQHQFNSLAAGHPQFDNFPYRTQRKIAFDHSAHEGKHFGTKNEKFECGRCHVDHLQKGALGSVFRSVGFEKACASCHNDSIKSTTINGWALIQLPSIAPADAQADSQRLNEWPASAQFGYEGEISVALRFLLAADPEVHEALSRLPASGKIQDLAGGEEERAQVARALARGVRRLIADVALDGQLAWKRRLKDIGQASLGRDLNPHELQLIDLMSNGLPPDLFRQMELRWFGNQHGIASTVALPVRLVSQLQDQSLLAGDSLLDASSATQDDLVLGDDDSLLNDVSDATSADVSKADSVRFTNIKGSEHVADGGWYLDQELLALRYMPRGHADGTLAAWAEFSTLVDHAARLGQATIAKRGLQHADGVPGACTECHVLAPQRAEALDDFSNWSSAKRPTLVRLFTKFDHTPHLTLPSLSDCRHCHVANSQSVLSLGQIHAEHASSVGDRQLEQAAVCEFLEAEFSMMRLEQCSTCHRAGGAKDACTQCHNYHVGTQGLEWSK